jgi:hypothetical protein
VIGWLVISGNLPIIYVVWIQLWSLLRLSNKMREMQNKTQWAVKILEKKKM